VIKRVVWIVEWNDTEWEVNRSVFDGKDEEDLGRRFGRRWMPDEDIRRYATEDEALQRLIEEIGSDITLGWKRIAETAERIGLLRGTSG